MRKRIWAISVILAGSLALTGCGQAAQTATKEKPASDKTAIKQKQAPVKQAEKPKPVQVNIIDPTTNKTIRTITPKEMGYGKDNGKYTKEIEAFAEFQARGKGLDTGYDQRNIPDRIGANGQIIKGKPRRILDEEKLSKAIIAASAKGGNVQLPITVSPSGYTPAEASHLSEAVIATYTTYFTNVPGRTRNIQLSAQAINNVIIGTNDYFSFNTTVGPSDKAHGYQEAKEAVDGKLVNGIGGGICQTSSTLYNAVDQLRVTYIEKHHHSVHVGYVPKGRDATVSYGGVDFRFQNTSGIPFIIKAITDKAHGKLTIEIRTSKAHLPQLKKR
jgi:vancomycin resistance protein YoaR